jgi:hypothetical protein
MSADQAPPVHTTEEHHVHTTGDIGDTLQPPVEVLAAPGDQPVIAVDDASIEQVAHQAIDLAQTPHSTTEEEDAPSHQPTAEEDAPSDHAKTVEEPTSADEALYLAASVESQEDTDTLDAPSARAHTPQPEVEQTDADEQTTDLWHVTDSKEQETNECQTTTEVIITSNSHSVIVRNNTVYFMYHQ